MKCAEPTEDQFARLGVMGKRRLVLILFDREVDFFSKLSQRDFVNVGGHINFLEVAGDV